MGYYEHGSGLTAQAVRLALSLLCVGVLLPVLFTVINRAASLSIAGGRGLFDLWVQIKGTVYLGLWLGWVTIPILFALCLVALFALDLVECTVFRFQLVAVGVVVAWQVVAYLLFGVPVMTPSVLAQVAATVLTGMGIGTLLYGVLVYNWARRVRRPNVESRR